MATTMDIRLNYGAWPGIEGDTTESTTSREASLALYGPGHADEFQHSSTLRGQQSPALELSDLFSDSGEIVPEQGLVKAEMSEVSQANTSHHISHPLNPPRGSEGTNPSTSEQRYIYDSSVVDLTDSPPQPLVRTNTNPWRTSFPPPSQEQSTMPPTTRSRARSRRTHLSSPPARHTEERPRKRRRLSATSPATGPPEPDTDNAQLIEAVDLTEVNDDSELSRAISKQQQDAVQSQMKHAQDDDLPGRTPLTSYKCPICMDTPEDATSTICGEFEFIPTIHFLAASSHPC